MAGPVLLVHDDIATIAAVRRVLSREGYEVILATSAADALIAFGHYLPQLVVLAPSVESHRGKLVLEELSQHPDAQLARVLLLGEAIPSFTAPFVPLPLDGASFLQSVEAAMSGKDGSGEWRVVESSFTPQLALVGEASEPAEPEAWRATGPTGPLLPDPLPSAQPASPALEQALFGDLSPDLHQADWELAAVRPHERDEVTRRRDRVRRVEAAADQALQLAQQEIEAEAMASIDSTLARHSGARGLDKDAPPTGAKRPAALDGEAQSEDTVLARNPFDARARAEAMTEPHEALFRDAGPSSDSDAADDEGSVEWGEPNRAPSVSDVETPGANSMAGADPFEGEGAADEATREIDASGASEDWSSVSADASDATSEFDASAAYEGWDHGASGEAGAAAGSADDEVTTAEDTTGEVDASHARAGWPSESAEDAEERDGATGEVDAGDARAGWPSESGEDPEESDGATGEVDAADARAGWPSESAEDAEERDDATGEIDAADARAGWPSESADVAEPTDEATGDVEESPAGADWNEAAADETTSERDASSAGGAWNEADADEKTSELDPSSTGADWNEASAEETTGELDAPSAGAGWQEAAADEASGELAASSTGAGWNEAAADETTGGLDASATGADWNDSVPTRGADASDGESSGYDAPAEDAWLLSEPSNGAASAHRATGATDGSSDHDSSDHDSSGGQEAIGAAADSLSSRLGAAGHLSAALDPSATTLEQRLFGDEFSPPSDDDSPRGAQEAAVPEVASAPSRKSGWRFPSDDEGGWSPSPLQETANATPDELQPGASAPVHPDKSHPDPWAAAALAFPEQPSAIPTEHTAVFGSAGQYPVDGDDVIVQSVQHQGAWSNAFVAENGPVGSWSTESLAEEWAHFSSEDSGVIVASDVPWSRAENGGPAPDLVDPESVASRSAWEPSGDDSWNRPAHLDGAAHGDPVPSDFELEARRLAEALATRELELTEHAQLRAEVEASARETKRLADELARRELELVEKSQLAEALAVREAELAKKEQLVEELVRREVELAAKERRIEELARREAELASTEQLVEELARREAELARKEQLVEELERREAELAEKERLHAEAEAVALEAQSKAAALEAELVERERLRGEAEARARAAERAAEDALNRQLALVDASGAGSAEAARLVHALAAREQELKALRAEESRWREELESLRLEERQHAEELEALHGHETEHRAELEALRGEEARHRAELETLREEEARRIAEVQALRAEEARHIAEVEALRVEEARHSAEVQALREEEARHSAELEALRAEEVRKLAELVAEREAELQKQQAAEAVTRAELQEAIAAVEQRAREEIARMDRTFESARAELERQLEDERERALRSSEEVLGRASEREQEAFALAEEARQEAEVARQEAERVAARLREELEAEQVARREEWVAERDHLTAELTRLREVAERAQSHADEAQQRAEDERHVREQEEEARHHAEREADRAREEAQRAVEQVQSALAFGAPRVEGALPPRAGRLDRTALAKLVVDLALAPGSYRLELKSGDALRVLWFTGGRLVGAASSAEGESLLDRARRDGLIDVRQENELRLLRTSSTGALARILRERGYLRDTEVVPLVQRHAEQLALEAFCELEALYRLSEESPSPDVALAASARASLELLAEGLRRGFAGEPLLAQLGGLRAVPRLREVKFAPEALGLAGRELELIKLVDGELTLERLMLRAGLPQERALRVLALVRLLGLIELDASVAVDEVPGDLDVQRLEAKFGELQEADYFVVLGLARTAGAQEVRRAFELLGTEFHPLRFAGHPDPLLQQRAHQVHAILAEAAQALEDDRLRTEYARNLVD